MKGGREAEVCDTISKHEQMVAWEQWGVLGRVANSGHILKVNKICQGIWLKDDRKKKKRKVEIFFQGNGKDEVAPF